MRIVVIGGGISGLTASFLATAAGHDVTCVEPGMPGGLIRSIREEGFLCETGPQAVLDDAPDTMALIDALGLTPRRLKALPSAARRFIYTRGALRAIPKGPGGLLTSGLLSFAGKLRLFREPFVSAATVSADDDSETVLAFGARRLGPEAARVLMATAVIGIYAGDAAELSLSSAFPRLAAFEREHGGLLAGLRASRRTGRRRGHPLSFPDGLGELPLAMAGALGERVIATRATALVPLPNGAWQVEFQPAAISGSSTHPDARSPWPSHLEAEAVVVATDANAAVDLLSRHVPEACLLSNVPAAPVAICCLGFRDTVARPLGLDTGAYGFLVARGEHPRLLGCQYESSTFAERAPDGGVLLRGILGGLGQGFDPAVIDRSDDQIATDTLADLKQVAGLARTPDFVRVWRHPAGIPQYRPGHRQLVAAVDAGLRRRPGLHLLGHTLRGVGVNEGIRAASALVRRLSDGAAIENFR